jgi:NAD(P)-dependent dehydrogenase (short-subunit alcohol dehydrogenase family)
MELGLKGKVALVTGASRGLGAAIALELAREGALVCLAARDAAKLDEVAGQIRALHNQGGQGAAVTVVGDLRRLADVEAAVAATLKAFGRIDILVNNAGATRRGDFLDLTEEDWDDGFALKFRGYVRASRAAWPHLKATKGTIINIVGIGARTGAAEFTIGGSVNAALLYFTKALAQDGMRDGIRVNAINPGHIETERLGRSFARIAARDGISLDAARSRLLADCGTTRFGQPEEIAHAVAFLASGKADFFQGSLIDLDGGETRGL